MSLSTLVNFTDQSGRTSCAKDEREHYRLHCLGLVKLAVSVKQDAWSTPRQVTQLEDSVDIAAKNHGDDPAYAFKVVLYRRRIKVLGPFAEAAEAKLIRVEAELDPILWRNVFVQEDICDLVIEKLPLELLDIVYEHVDPFNEPIQVDCEIQQVQQDTACPQDGVRYEYESNFFDGDCSQMSWDAPWYLDTRIVSKQFAVEMLETLHRKTVFVIEHPEILERFLQENRWKGFEDFIPKDMVRKIVINLPLNVYITDKLTGAEVASMLEPLRTLTQNVVRITIDIQSDLQFIAGKKQRYPEHIKETIEELDQDDEAPISEKMYKYREIVTEGLLTMLLNQLLPLLRHLFEMRHVIKIENKLEYWSWVMTKSHMSKEDVLQYRRSHWYGRNNGKFLLVADPDADEDAHDETGG